MSVVAQQTSLSLGCPPPTLRLVTLRDRPWLPLRPVGRGGRQPPKGQQPSCSRSRVFSARCLSISISISISRHGSCTHGCVIRETNHEGRSGFGRASLHLSIDRSIHPSLYLSLSISTHLAVLDPFANEARRELEPGAARHRRGTGAQVEHDDDRGFEPSLRRAARPAQAAVRGDGRQ